jgi:hypothetical protein
MPGILKEFAIDGMGDGGFMFGQNDQNISNEQIVLAATTIAIPSGAVLGKITASGLYVPVDPAATDGSQNGVAILFYGKPISTVTQKAAAVVRRQGVNGNALVYLKTVTAQQKATIEAALAVNGIIVRY